jgi:hypothetical protein
MEFQRPCISASAANHPWLLAAMSIATGGMAAALFMSPNAADKAILQAPILSIQQMGHLVSLKVNYSDVIEFEEQHKIDLPLNQEVSLGATKVLLVAKGDCTLATDLKAAAYDKVDQDKRTLTVTLAAPRPLQARLIHEAREKGGSYFYATSSRGLVALTPNSSHRTKAMNNALARAQHALTRACIAAPNISAAMEQAEQVLGAMFRQAGWTTSFAWKEPAH